MIRQLLKRKKVYSRLHFNRFLSFSCLLCRDDTTASESLCALCRQTFPVAEHHCQFCGIPMATDSVTTCARCLQKKPAFNQCHCAWNYAYPINHLIQKIKHEKELTFLPPMAKQLAHVLQHKYDDRPWPQVLVPVPLHTARLRSRGFNQSLLLAKALVKSLHHISPVQINKHLIDNRLIKRVRNTPAQQGLKAAQRRSNIRGAFAMNKEPVHYCHIALIDDVVTTGETVSELASLLKKQGVETVDVWCLARTPP